MPKRRYPKLPNGYGSIKYLKNKKRNRYAVHPPTTEFTLAGVPKTPKAICYVDDWFSAFEILTAYKAGTYEPGMECKLNLAPNKSVLVESIISDYNRIRGIQKEESLTFAEVFDLYYSDKFENTKKEYSYSTRQYPKTAFSKCQKLHGRPFKDITVEELQENLDSCKLKHSTLEIIKNLYNGMYKYAFAHGIVDRELSKYVTIRIPDDDNHGTPFTPDDLRMLWRNKDNLTALRIIIMSLTGYRIGAYRTIRVHPEYFIGGNKTRAGRDNLVPLHSYIKPYIKQAKMREMIPKHFRTELRELLQAFGIKDHTPHDSRHTFSMLCDMYEVNPIARKKMLGHSIDMSNDIYGHWDYSMLKKEIEKIRIFD